MSKLPSLSGLGLGKFEVKSLAKFDRSELRELGWAAAGGAVGSAAMSYVRPWIAKLPFVGTMPMATDLLTGALLSHVAYKFNKTMGAGLAGATVGRTAGSWVMGLLGQTMSGLNALPEEVELAQTDQLAPPSEELVLDPSEFAEVEPMPEFGGTVEEEQSFAYLS